MDNNTDLALLPPPTETTLSEGDLAENKTETPPTETESPPTEPTTPDKTTPEPEEPPVQEERKADNPLRFMVKAGMVLLGLFASVLFSVLLIDGVGGLHQTGFAKLALGELFGGSANISTIPLSQGESTTSPSTEQPDSPPNEQKETTPHESESQSASETLSPAPFPPLIDNNLGIVTADLSSKGEHGLTLINETPYHPPLSSKSERTIPTLSELYSEHGTDAPVVLIIHTHGTESYAQSGAASTSDQEYRSLDPEENMLTVGKALTEALTERGINTIHCEELFDAEDFTMAYYNASLYIRKALQKYPSIAYILDLHRDSIAYANGEKTLRPTTIIDGKPYAQIMLVVGTDHGGSGHSEWTDNFNLACRLQSRIHTDHSKLMRAINLRSASFNQQYTKGSLLIEMGAVGSSMEEAVNSAKILGDYLADEIIGSDEETKELQAVQSGDPEKNAGIRETSACLPQQDWGA